MKDVERLRVLYKGETVGHLAQYSSYQTSFSYTREWLAQGFSLNPYSLPLEDKIFVAKPEPFDGLHGVFADSLPDGWGRLLVDRMLLKNQKNPRAISPLTRLAIVGSTGMGALTYYPEQELASSPLQTDLDLLAQQCAQLLHNDYTDNLEQLFQLGGSSGGARPKILTTIEGEEWIIKFPATADNKNIGLQEYAYSLCAKACGIEMTETRLFPSQLGPGYFGTRRFDRDSMGQGIHMVSVSGLLETSHRLPNLDYHILFQLTLSLTKDYQELEKLYKLMCFNVFAHNRDDHSKNFTFLYNHQQKKWQLSPAYDLTYSYSLGGEHATTVNGNGQNPSLKDLLAVAKKAGLDCYKAKETALAIQEQVNKDLYMYLK